VPNNRSSDLLHSGDGQYGCLAMCDMLHVRVQIVATASTPFITCPHQRSPVLTQTAMQGQVLDPIPYTRIGGDGSGLSNYQQIKVLGKTEHEEADCCVPAGTALI
jgi:hypothetical protein